MTTTVPKNNDKEPTEQPMRAQLLALTKGMKKDGFDFVKKHPTFQWKYEEDPNLVFSLQIKEVVEKEPEYKEESPILTAPLEIIK
jgi:hypothetical protein